MITALTADRRYLILYVRLRRFTLNALESAAALELRVPAIPTEARMTNDGSALVGPPPFGHHLDPIVWAEVSRIRSHWAVEPGLTPEQRSGRIAREAADLSELVDIEELEIVRDYLAGWTSAHRGATPDAAHAARLSTETRDQARREVLDTRLYPLVSAHAIAEYRSTVERAADRRPHDRTPTDPERWYQAVVAVTPAAEDIVMRTWGRLRSLDFTLLALGLIQVRLDDGSAIPITPLDPLTEELTAMIHERLIADGLPPL